MYEYIIHKARDHCLQQGVRSHSPHRDNCMYRSHDGLMCAAGPFIPDDKYDYEMEFNPFSTVNYQWRLGFDSNEEMVLDLCQQVHDFGDIKDWPYLFQALEMCVNTFSLEEITWYVISVYAKQLKNS